MDDTWVTLQNELKYYGIKLLNSRECQRYKDGSTGTQGVVKTMRQLNITIKKQKKELLNLWKELVGDLKEESYQNHILDDKLQNLFIHSLKGLYQFLCCFDDDSFFHIKVIEALSRDINSFSKEQINVIPEYKIAIDWQHRLVSRLIYIKRLLSYAAMGEKRVSKYDVKTAKGLAGPWSRLDLPMLERVFPFGSEIEMRQKDKQNQRRYRKGLQNYNNDGRVSEGHYWRELRNEPFSWYDRNEEDPYPSRHYLSR